MNELSERGSGGGCILAHCMGLGKTLTSICFTITLLSSPLMTKIADPIAQKKVEEMETKRKEETLRRRNARKGKALLKDGMKSDDEDNEDDSEDNESIGLPAVILETPMKRLFQKILILAPVNTVKNWFDEYHRWTPPELKSYTKVKLLTASIKKTNRMSILRSWSSEGGVLILGYDLFRSMTGEDDTKVGIDISDDNVDISAAKDNSKRSRVDKFSTARSRRPDPIQERDQAEARRLA